MRFAGLSSERHLPQRAQSSQSNAKAGKSRFLVSPVCVEQARDDNSTTRWSALRLVAGFGVEGFHVRVAEAVAADEVHDQEHQQGAGDHHDYGYLQAED